MHVFLHLFDDQDFWEILGIEELVGSELDLPLVDHARSLLVVESLFALNYF